jgi:nicotinamide phosphoribosyltransferase
MPLPLIIDSDSYKTSHYLQYPPDTKYVSSYIEARQSFFRGMSLLEPVGYDGSVFFGLQYFLKNFLSEPITHVMVDRMRDICKAHGVPFNERGWRALVYQHGGVLPLEISAIPEGSVAMSNVPQVQVINTDPDFYWLTSYIETRLLSVVWYGSTVATLSREIKRLLREKLLQTGCTLDGIDFMLHDFGSRGASSQESAGIGGMAHLINFKGTDTLAAIYAAKEFYGEPMAGFSIPAAEHSTITAWTRDGEEESFRNMLKQYGKPGAIVAVVSDSYDLYGAVRYLWGEKLKAEVEAFGAQGGKLVIRPDSGVPEKIVPDVLDILGEKFGYTKNAAGFKVLPPYIGVIQGDGINYQSIKRILQAMIDRKWAVSNIAFGMGGALLQQVNRDTLGYAMKANAMCINREWRDIYKSPATDNQKKSKRGRQGVVLDPVLGLTAKPLAEFTDADVNIMQPVWRNGELIRDISFAEVRENAKLK